MTTGVPHSAAPARGVGLVLAVVQFFFALSWTVYVIFLPTLAQQAGLPRAAVTWILMLDQLVFVLADYAAGLASDRAALALRRIGPAVLAVTLLSCAALLALPFVAPTGSVPLFLGLTLLWSVSSSALRAPPLTLIGRHAARPTRPGLVALSLSGLGLASAAAPYLALQLRDLDPRAPFVLSSLALALATLGIVAAERRLTLRPGGPTAVGKSLAPAPPGFPAPSTAAVFFGAALLAALAFQVHGFINSAPLYLRHAGTAQLPYLAPLFWVGFNLALWPAGVAVRRWGAERVMLAGTLAAAAAALLAQLAGDLAILVGAQCLAGAAWAGLLMSAFALALAFGQVGREGRFSGALSSLLAVAALARLGVLAAALPQVGSARALLAWVPTVAWLLAALLAWRLAPHAAAGAGAPE